MMTYIFLLGKLLIGFVALLFIIRLLGKKELSAASPLDVIYAAALGDLIVDAAYDPKVKIPEIVVGLVAWTAFIYFTDKISRSNEKISKVIKGEADLIIYRGRMIPAALKRNRLSKEEVKSLLRQKEIFNVADVELGILELNGELSIKKLN